MSTLLQYSQGAYGMDAGPVYDQWNGQIYGELQLDAL